MIVSPVKQNSAFGAANHFVWRFFILSFVTVCLLVPAIGHAQSGPTVLKPTGTNPDTGVTKSPLSLRLPARRTPKPTNLKSKSGIEVNVLDQVGLDTAGVLSPGQGGFGVSMWNGLPRAYIVKMLPLLPVKSPSPIMRNLMHRLLLTRAVAPEGETDGINLVAVRVKLLAALGNFDGVKALLKTIPGRQEGEEVAKIEVEINFLANDNVAACALVANEVLKSDNLYWQKVHSFCLTLAGEYDKAALSISLMRELGEQDEVFFTLIDAMVHKTPVEIETMEDPQPLHLAMMRALKARLPDDVVNTKNPIILRAVAMNPDVAKEIRLEAAERAEISGALPTKSLQQLISSIKFTKEDLSNPLTRADTEFGPTIRALLYHSSLVQSVPIAKAEVIARALKLGHEEGRYGSAVRVFSPVIQQIQPSVDLLWFANDAVRTLLADGAPELAESWIRLMRTRAISNAEAQTAIIELMPIARLMGYQGSSLWYQDALSNWQRNGGMETGNLNKFAVMVGLYEALEEPVPDHVYQTLVGVSTGLQDDFTWPDMNVWLRLKSILGNLQRGDAHSLGDVIVVSMMLLGEEGVGKLPMPVIRDVIRALRTVNLQSEARSLAVEYALAAGL